MFQKKIKHRYLIFNLFDIIFLSLFDFNDFTHTYQTSKPEKKDGHQSTITGQSVSQSGDQLIYSIRKNTISFYSVFRKWKIPLLYFILIFSLFCFIAKADYFRYIKHHYHYHHHLDPSLTECIALIINNQTKPRKKISHIIDGHIMLFHWPRVTHTHSSLEWTTDVSFNNDNDNNKKTKLVWKKI